ncbi:uncharacterized protein VTP21DRAFT_8438 [Calcarisporiella thermophila]|uniref:uncharacterized protein n=1 Tax=Calcarisporiella thermophila TaxID=911321 RepID=UPI003742C686
MAAQNQSIQTLLEAEKEAAKIVQKAKQYRVQRLKDARTEATKEIEQLKHQKEEEFKMYEKEHTGTSSQLVQRLEAETEQKIKEIREQYEKNKKEVVEKLLLTVTTVEPKIHENFRASQ